MGFVEDSDIIAVTKTQPEEEGDLDEDEDW